MSSELHYPNLEHCVIFPGAASSNKNAPPNVTLTPECLEAMDAPLPEIYDFHVGKETQWLVVLHAHDYHLIRSVSEYYDQLSLL